MKITAKFKINRAGFRNQVLKDNGDAGIRDALEAATKSVAPAGTQVETSYAKDRFRVRIVDTTDGAADRESKSGALSQALNRLRL